MLIFRAVWLSNLYYEMTHSSHHRKASAPQGTQKQQTQAEGWAEVA